jgi:glycosyltransferase involved in cell wall biosynthesis
MNEQLGTLKVGYTAYSDDYSMPSDRRRFIGYIKHRGITIEEADLNKDYDVVFLTYVGDLPRWIEKKKREKDKFKLIFELQDFYLAEPFSFKSVFRGLAKYVTGGTSKLYLDYKSLLKEACRVADAVVCTSEEQKSAILTYNSNVHICLDYFEDEIQTIKSDYSFKSEKLKLVWEGQAGTLSNLLVIKDVLNDLKEEVELHVITDLSYYKYANKYGKTDSTKILKNIKCDKYFYNWEKAHFNKQIIDCDLAIIPIDLGNGLQNGKPENKLILFWLMGMPVLASSTPAYQRIMEKSDTNLSMKTGQDWHRQIVSYKRLAEDDREQLGSKCYQFSKQNYSRECIGEMWDKVLSSLESPLSIF